MGNACIVFDPGLALVGVGWMGGKRFHRQKELAMSIRPIIRALLVMAVPIGICSCIGATEAVPYDAAMPKSSVAHSEERQSSVKKRETPCESPEMITGDTPTVGSTPCEESGLENQRRIWATPGTVTSQVPRSGVNDQERTWEPPGMYRDR